MDNSIQNASSYDYYQNFESYLLLMERSDWKKHLALKDKNNYSSS